MEVIYLNHPSRLNHITDHVMAIGFFDGVHLGHQELFATAKKYASKKGMTCSALTFSPHPDEVIKGDKNRKYITPLREKIAKIASYGIDKLFVMNFDPHFASLPPIEFIRQYIVDMNAKHIVVGFDFTFGFKAEGDIELLKQEAATGSFELSIIPKKTYLDAKIGSTEVKKVIQEGNVDLVPYYLGTHYEVNARIYHFSSNSCKLVINTQHILPKPGVYAVKVSQGKDIFYGEVTVQPNFDTKLLLYEYENPNDQALKIAFLNRLAVKRTVFV